MKQLSLPRPPPTHPFPVSSLMRKGAPEPRFSTDLGALFCGDSLKILPQLRDGVIDTIFADPPFNIGKKYGANTDDLRPDNEYLLWCKQWLSECVRVLKPGGALFVYNLPKWNILLGSYLF